MRCGKPGVPKYWSGSATGPPLPRSWSFWSSIAAFHGLKKSCAEMVPSPATPSRTTDCESCCGTGEPGPLGAVTPLPLATKIRPGPSDIRPPPPCQIPDPVLVAPTSSDQRSTARVLMLTPATQPTYVP